MNFDYKTFVFVAICKDDGNPLPKSTVIAKNKDEAYEKAKDSLRLHGYNAKDYCISVHDW